VGITLRPSNERGQAVSTGSRRLRGGAPVSAESAFQPLSGCPQDQHLRWQRRGPNVRRAAEVPSPRALAVFSDFEPPRGLETRGGHRPLGRPGSAIDPTGAATCLRGIQPTPLKWGESSKFRALRASAGTSPPRDLTEQRSPDAKPGLSHPATAARGRMWDARRKHPRRAPSLTSSSSRRAPFDLTFSGAPP
jgi:hypothetical protein